jgi:hypothetical protein
VGEARRSSSRGGTGLVGETRCHPKEPRRVSTHVEVVPSAECPIGARGPSRGPVAFDRCGFASPLAARERYCSRAQRLSRSCPDHGHRGWAWHGEGTRHRASAFGGMCAMPSRSSRASWWSSRPWRYHPAEARESTAADWAQARRGSLVGRGSRRSVALRQRAASDARVATRARCFDGPASDARVATRARCFDGPASADCAKPGWQRRGRADGVHITPASGGRASAHFTWRCWRAAIRCAACPPTAPKAAPKGATCRSRDLQPQCCTEIIRGRGRLWN